MKKVFLFFAFLVLVTAIQAQVKFGVKAGLNISNIAGSEEADDFRSKTGFHVGSFANLSLTSRLSIQPEILYSTQGARWDDDNEKTSLNYLQLPILAKYEIARGFFAEAGPQLGLLLKAEDDNEGDIEDVKKYLKKNDFSLVLGAGYNVIPGLAVNVRYNRALTRFYEDEKNSVFQFGVSYTFGKAK